VNTPVLVCPRREIAFGDLGDWRDISSIALQENVRNARPQQGTGVQCVWDEAALHVLFTCVDRHPWATITERDGPLWEEEVVEVFLDPIGDYEAYFEFEVNPLNTVLDLVLRKNRSGYRKDFAWNCEGLLTEVRRTAEGWTTEFLIPFTALVREPPRLASEWRVNFFRIDRPPDQERELSAWSPTLLPNFHVPQRFGRLQFG
jgi:hypothetical protein